MIIIFFFISLISMCYFLFHGLTSVGVTSAPVCVYVFFFYFFQVVYVWVKIVRCDDSLSLNKDISISKLIDTHTKEKKSIIHQVTSRLIRVEFIKCASTTIFELETNNNTWLILNRIRNWLKQTQHQLRTTNQNRSSIILMC